MTAYGIDGQLHWTPYPLQLDSKINSIGFDLHNTVWFGAQNGVENLNVSSSVRGSYCADSTVSGSPCGPVRVVVTNHQSIRWFGTETGLARLSDTTWTHFTAENSPLPSDTVTALLYDFNQNLWIGTVNGLAVYNEAGITF